MDWSKNDVKLGRFLCLVLRHHPEEAGIALDEHGWADVRALLDGVCSTGRQIGQGDTGADHPGGQQAAVFVQRRPHQDSG